MEEVMGVSDGEGWGFGCGEIWERVGRGFVKGSGGMGLRIVRVKAFVVVVWGSSCLRSERIRSQSAARFRDLRKRYLDGSTSNHLTPHYLTDHTITAPEQKSDDFIRDTGPFSGCHTKGKSSNDRFPAPSILL